MDFDTQLSQLCAGDGILIQCNNLYVYSNGFYPPFLKVKQHLQIESMIFHIYSVQFDNEEILITDHQDNLQFSQDIVIKLAKSNKCISVILHQDKWTLSLQDQVDRTSLFRIEPCYKSQIQNSNRISFDDDVFIMFSPENTALSGFESQDLFAIAPEVNSLKNLNYFTLQPTKTTKFQFRKVSQQKVGLCYGSLIKIKQIEKDAHLELTTIENVQSNDYNNNIHLTDVKSQYQRIYSQNWVVGWRCREKKQQNIDLLQYDIWRLYHPQKINQTIKQGDTFYLQNLSGNFFLHGDTVKQNYKEASLFSFTEQESINSTLFYLQSNNQTLTYKNQNEMSFGQTQDRYSIDYRAKKSKYDLLQFEVISNVNITHQNWLDNIVKLITQTHSYFSKNSEEIHLFLKNQSINDGKFDEFFDMLEQVENAINDLTLFCIDGEEKPKIIDKNGILYLKMNTYNQGLIRKKMIVQSLVQLIDITKWEYSYTQVIEQLQDSKRNVSLEDLNMQLLFQINNVINQAFIFFEAFSSHNDHNSQMIFLAYFQLKQLLGYNVGAFYCLIRLFVKNQSLIPIAGMMPFLSVSEKEQDFTLIKRSTRINTVLTKQQNLLQSATLIDEIFERAQYCQKVLNKRFWANVVKILGVLCLQNDTACFNNQMIIGKHIMQGPKIMLQFINKGDILFVDIEGQQFELNEIYVQSSKANKDFMNEILECRNFLDSQLHLIGLLCQERNYENIQYYRAKLSQKTLTSYISNSRNAEQLRCRLIIILMNLYVDCYPYQPKQMPKLIFNLNKILDKDSQKQTVNLEQSQMEMTEIVSKQISKQLTRQFTINDTLAIEKLLNITQELVKLNLIQQNQLNLSLSVCKILQMFYKLYTFNLPKNKEFHEKYFDVNLLIQAYILLPNSLQQIQPLQEQFQQHIQFQEEKEIFNSMAIVLIDFLLLYFEIVETKILELSIKFSENQDQLILINNQHNSNFDKIKGNTFLLLKHKQSQPETKLYAFKLIESIHQPKRNIVRRLKKCLFLQDEDQLQNYSFLKKTILLLRELESAADKQPLYKSCIKSLSDLNRLMQITNNPLLMQKMLRILNVDNILLDFLDSYSSICDLVTQKFLRSNKDERYQLQLSEEEEEVIKFCTQSLSILKQFCSGNQKNKLRIISKFNQFDDLLKCIELGQYELLVEIYKESYENIQSASSRIIFMLLENLNIGALKVLEALLSQQNMICQKNVEEIISQITTVKKFLQTLGFKDQGIEKVLSQAAHSTFQVQFQLGNMPYVIQIYALQFTQKILTNQSQQTQRIFQNLFPTQKILKNILSLKDIFLFQIDNLDKAILSTILKQQLLRLFNQLLNFKDIFKYDDEVQQLLVQFIDQEIKIFNDKIVNLNYDLCKQAHDIEKKYDLIVKNFGFKMQQTSISKQQIFKQVDSGSSEGEDSPIKIGDDQSKLIACYPLQDYFSCIQFNNYALLLFDAFLCLAQLIQEQIDNLEDTTSKSGRASSSFARQMSLSQGLSDMSSSEMNQSLKMKPYSNLKNKIDSFLKYIEEHLNQNLTKWEIIDNGNFLIEKQQMLKILFFRKLDLVNYNLDQIQPKKNIATLDIYCSPTYFHDKRIHELLLLSEKADNEGFIVKQINCIMTSSDELGQENFKMFSEIYAQQLLVTEDFEIISENFPNILVPIISCFQSSMNNIPKNYKTIITMLRFLSQLIDIHTYIRENYTQTMKVYQMNKRGKYHTKSEQILQIKAIKYLQNLIVNQGFFSVFISYCNLYDKIRIISNSELGVKNNKKKEKLLYQFLLVSIRLVRGIEQANQFAQQNLMQEIQRTKSNYLLKIFASVFEKQQQIDEVQQQRYQLQNEIDRVYLAYEFNETHRLEQKKDQMKLGLLQIQMRLLQLLAEDHYRPFQDFFREQVGFPQNYDILQHLVNILLTYFNNESFYSLSQDDYILVLNCFDCIKEFIQGPCPQNQEKICTPPFLRLCFKLLSYDDSQFKFLTLYPQFSKPEQIAIKQDQDRQRVSTQDFVRKQNYIQNKTVLQQNFIQFYIKNQKYCRFLVQSFRKSNSANYKLYMLSEIKYRCATTLESLTDNDQNESDILKKISLIINEKILIRNITIQYEKYKILHGSGKNYTNLVFSHLLGDEVKEKNYDKKIRKNKVSLMLQPSHYWYQVEEEITAEIAVNDFWSSFIIETGFSLFNLLAQIYQMKDQDILERIYEQIDNTKTEKKKFKSIIFYNLYQSIFSASQITKNLKQLQQSSKVSNKVFSVYKLKKATGEAEAQQKKLGYRALRFFATRTGSIEILLETKQLKKLMFPLVPHCFALNDEIKNKFASDIDRLSQQRKVESVLSNSSHIIQKLQTEYKFQTLYKKNFIVNLLASNQKLWKQIIFFVIVLENIMILFSSEGQMYPIFSDILFGLTITQIILQFICFFIFIVKKLPYLRIKSQEIVFERQINRIRKREIKYKYLDNSQSVVLQEDFVLEKTDSFLLEQNKWRRMYFDISDSLVLPKCILLDYEMIYFLIFTSLAFIGLYINIVLALLLLDVFWRFPTLTSIVNAIWRPSGQILLVLSLYIIMQYYYSLIVYHYYAEFYSPYCQNLLQCFSFILDVTFKTDGGSVGYVSNSDTYSDENFRYSILNFWEFVYVFVVISLLYSIITGIIIDSFGVLRDEAEELDNDIKGFCLICGIDRGTLEKKAKHKKGFRFHVKYEHCVWNYIFYISYLQDKKKSDYNGIESYVDSNLKKESINWFPINKSLSIPDEGDDQEGINNLKKNIDDKLVEISHKLDQLQS